MPAKSNHVVLLDHYGSDLQIATAAWVSTGVEINEEKKNRVDKMIASLWADGHGTPFEQSDVRFMVTSEIATHIHFLKHRISSINSESARYKQIVDDEYYVPEDWKGVKVSKDIMSFAQEGDEWLDIFKAYSELGMSLYNQALADASPDDKLGRKRAKESARYFRAYNAQMSFIVKFNMRSFANFLRLRDDDHAQKEVHEIASKMAQLVMEISNNPFEHTMKAFGYPK